MMINPFIQNDLSVFRVQEMGMAVNLPQGQVEEHGKGAPYHVIQAKYSLDERQNLWRAVLQDQQGQEIDAKGSDITDEELKKYFGDQADAVRALLNKRTDVKLSELLPIRNQQGFDQVLKTLTEREDIQVSDLVTRTKDGRVRIDQSVTDDETKELMEHRKDIKPKELGDLRAQLVKVLGNPVLAKKAFTQALKLLKNRTDLKPEAVGDMFTKISDAMDSLQGAGGKKSASAAGAKLEMFETSVELLCTRRDLQPEHMVKLAQSTVQCMGEKDDQNSPTRISNSFRDAANLLMTRKDISVDQVTGFMSTLKQMSPGKDPAALDNRASIFSTACKTLAQRPDMNFDQMTELLKRQTQGANPKQGNALMKNFNDAAAGLAKGQTIDQVADSIPRQEEQRRKAEAERRPGEEARKPGDPAGPEDKKDLAARDERIEPVGQQDGPIKRPGEKQQKPNAP